MRVCNLNSNIPRRLLSARVHSQYLRHRRPAVRGIYDRFALSVCKTSLIDSPVLRKALTVNGGFDALNRETERRNGRGYSGENHVASDAAFGRQQSETIKLLGRGVQGYVISYLFGYSYPGLQVSRDT